GQHAEWVVDPPPGRTQVFGVRVEWCAAALADNGDGFSGPRGDGEVAIHGRRKAEPAGVIGVLADDVDTARSHGHTGGLGYIRLPGESGGALLHCLARAVDDGPALADGLEAGAGCEWERPGIVICRDADTAGDRLGDLV